MKAVKRTIALILFLILIIGNLAFADDLVIIKERKPLTDFEGHWARGTIEKWLAAGRVSGYPDGSFKPDNKVTRAEFVKMVNGIIDYNKPNDITFKDVPATAWFYDYIRVAQAIGYISGYSADQFGPDDPITREQAAAILARIQYLRGNAAGANRFTDKGTLSAWALEAVGAATEAGFISGYVDGSFKPKNNLTRAEAITMLDNVLENSKNVIVYNDGTELKDMVIEGVLIIAKTVGEGNVYLTNLEIKGDIQVYGGGLNSIYFRNVKVARIEVIKDKVRLVFEDGSVVENIEVGEETVIVNEDGQIQTITVTDAEGVVLTGNFEEVTVSGVENITLKNAEIAKLIVEEKVTILGTGTIKTLEANADGILYEKNVKIDKVELGEGVKDKPEVIKEETTSSDSPVGLPPQTYKISVSAVIDGVEYKPLFTTSNYTGTKNISEFLKDEVVAILNTENSNIAQYFTKLNNKLGNLTINGTQVNTPDAVAKIKANLAGTEIVKGISDSIFDDSVLDEAEMKAILNAFKLSDLDKLDSIKLDRTIEYNGTITDPEIKIKGQDKNREELIEFLTTAGKLSINNFFKQYGPTVTLEIIDGEKTISFTVSKV